MTDANYVSLIVTKYMDDKTSCEIKADDKMTHSDNEVILAIKEIVIAQPTP